MSYMVSCVSSIGACVWCARPLFGVLVLTKRVAYIGHLGARARGERSDKWSVRDVHDV